MTREMISTSKDTHIAKHLAPEKRTQGGTAVRNLSSGHVPKLLRRPLLPICKREYFKREVLMQICDM